MRQIPEVRRIVRLTFGLGLLPEDLIVRGYMTILRHARDEGNYLYRMVHPFLVYVWTYWVSRQRTRCRMCVFGSQQRTNNACECHNRVLRQTVGTHPNIYAFIRKFMISFSPDVLKLVWSPSTELLCEAFMCPTL